MSLEALKSALENYEKDNESKEDVVGGRATDKKWFEQKEENKGETICVEGSRDELEEEVSFDSAVSAEVDE